MWPHLLPGQPAMSVSIKHASDHVGPSWLFISAFCDDGKIRKTGKSRYNRPNNHHIAIWTTASTKLQQRFTTELTVDTPYLPLTGELWSVCCARGGTPSLRVSRDAPRFCPPFSASGWSFCPPKFDHVYHFIQILLGPISKPPIFSM